MTEIDPSIETSSINSKSENSPSQQIKPNYWKLGFFSILFLLVISIGLIFYLLKTRKDNVTSNQLDILPTPTAITTSPQPTDAAKTMNARPLELLSLANSDKLSFKQTYKILWKNQALERWGDEIIVCLIGFDSSGKEIPAKKEMNEQLCTYRSGDLSGSYLITKTKLSNGSYDWTIPGDLLNRYVSQPTKFKIRLLVFDNLLSEGRTEWAGNVGWDESKEYLLIGKSL